MLQFPTLRPFGKQSFSKQSLSCWCVLFIFAAASTAFGNDDPPKAKASESTASELTEQKQKTSATETTAAKVASPPNGKAVKAVEQTKKTEAKTDENAADKPKGKPAPPATESESDSETSTDESDAQKTEDEVLAGHSSHGEAFNEGARQAAYLVEGMGKITFPVTAADDMAQKFVAQGVAQLHGFWYLEAERSFRQAAKIDPDCGMAYWGMAMANDKNSKRAKAFIAEAVSRKDKLTEREKMYIDSLDQYHKTESSKSKQRGERYLKDLEKIVYKFPEDNEAKAFICLQIWLNKRSQIPVTSYLAVNALLQQVLTEEPQHPCHHYVIHLWDYENADMALKSAANCGQSSPGIAHMWHMPGHIFSKLKRYSDAAWQQEASARVDHAHMIRDQILPDQIHNFAHNNEWLIRNLNNLGRVRDGIDLAMNMIDLPRHPKYNGLKKRGSTYYGRTRLFETLSRYELWDDLIELSESHYLERTTDEKEQVNRLRYLGRACFRSDRVERGREQLMILEQLLSKLKAERDPLVAAAEKKAKDAKKSEKDIKKAKSTAERPFKSRVLLIEKAIQELQGHDALVEEKFDDALALFKKASRVDTEFLVDVKLRAGKAAEAIEDAQKHVDSHKNEVRPLACLVETLWANGKKDECQKEFEKLRELGAQADIDVPTLARLTPIATKLGFEADWRKKDVELADDIGDRPPLDSLGPFRWHPSAASDWTLVDAENNPRSLSDYKGRPVVVIFYLGGGCLHCAEQLQAFAPMAKEYEKAGISLIAISTDNKKDHVEAWKAFAEEDAAFPFPLVSDEKLDVFRKWRVFDDFEETPLHGTFLVDGDGLIRWHDISYEPFNDPKFVLGEAKRLIDQTSTRVVVSKRD